MSLLLIVEDNPVDAEILCEHLELAGVDRRFVVTANTLKRMIAELDRYPHFDGIVLDLHLPDSSGWRETLREVRSRAGEDVSVFVHSGTQDPKVLSEVDGMDYVNKSEPDSAKKIVRRMLKKLAGGTDDKSLKEAAREALVRLSNGPVSPETRTMVSEILAKHGQLRHAQ